METLALDAVLLLHDELLQTPHRTLPPRPNLLPPLALDSQFSQLI
ncbi:MAG: hypothetical protein R6U67_10170 [Sodalinema sp.]